MLIALELLLEQGIDLRGGNPAVQTPLVSLGIQKDDGIVVPGIIVVSIVDDPIDLESSRQFAIRITHFIRVEHLVGLPREFAPGLIVKGIRKRGCLDEMGRPLVGIEPVTVP